MAIPDKPLEIKGIDLGQMTLAENRLIFGRRFNLDDFYQWLLDHTNWTEADAGAITRAEVLEVHAQVADRITELAVPLESKPSAEPTPG